MEISETADENTKRESRRQPDNVQNDPEDGISFNKMCWPIALNLFFQHLVTLQAISLVYQGKVLWSTVVLTIILVYAAGFSITVVRQRLWTHWLCNKANWQLGLILVICQALAVQSSLWQLVAWHRANCKRREKRINPHNATKGFFHTHIGWILTYDPLGLRTQLESIDMKEIEADPIVMWQDKHYDMIVLAQSALAVGIPWLFFGEKLWTAYVVADSARITISQHFTFLVDSAAHPYDKSVHAKKNKHVSFQTWDQVWHIPCPGATKHQSLEILTDLVPQ